MLVCFYVVFDQAAKSSMPSTSYSPLTASNGRADPTREHDLESLEGSGRSRANSTDEILLTKPQPATTSETKQDRDGKLDPTPPSGSTSYRPPGSRTSSQHQLVPGAASSYRFERYVARSTLNTLGPALVTAFYLFIVGVYLLRPGLNDVVPTYPIDARGIFFAWLILSIFVLDWAKSGLAGFEASALMKRKLAPSNAMQLMWHTDRGWGSVSGWWRALLEVWSLLRQKLSRGPRSHHEHEWKGPSSLWWYLAFSSFLLYLAIPLAGLSMDPGEAYKLTDRLITILGANETNFDSKLFNAITVEANSRWRQGNPTSPQGDTIFYAPAGTQNVSSTFYEDCIQAIYQGNHTEECAANNSITVFSGPEVTERAYGRAWGLEMNLSCSIANPYTELKMLDVKSINNWTAHPTFVNITSSSDDYGTDPESIANALNTVGLSPALFIMDTFTATAYQYVMVSSNDVSGDSGNSYINGSALPFPGSVELVLWQGFSPLFRPDATFANLSGHPAVVSSKSPIDNVTYLGYGIRCTVSTDVGFADLNAAARTYARFARKPATPFQQTLGDVPLTQYPGMYDIQSLIFGSFTTLNLGFEGPPICQPGASVGCSPWYGASLATGAVPFYGPMPQSNADADATRGPVRYPTITPERMNLAMYKLFGEMAIAMMASGFGPWSGGLRGLEAANTLVPGRVPWVIVLVLLGIWMAVTVLPNAWTFAEKRWAATLDGFEMFRIGAEWQKVVWRFEGSEFKENERVLLEVPGLIGDMEPDEKRGFVGLSYRTARVGREYGYDRANLN